MKNVRVWLTLTIAMVLATACQATSRPTGAVELLPSPGLAVITGDPAEASEDLVIRYITPEGEISGRSISIRAGEVIEFSAWHHPGPYRLQVNGEACRGSFPSEGEQRTAVTLRIGPSGCETVATEVVPITSG